MYAENRSICILVGPLRFELRTSRLSAVRSTELSYGPIMLVFRMTPSSRDTPNTHTGTLIFRSKLLFKLKLFIMNESSYKFAAIDLC